jgi:hypothetical protein
VANARHEGAVTGVSPAGNTCRHASRCAADMAARNAAARGRMAGGVATAFTTTNGKSVDGHGSRCEPNGRDQDDCSVQLDFLHGYLPFELGLLTPMFGNLVGSSAIAVVILMPIARECGNSVPPHLLVPRRAKRQAPATATMKPAREAVIEQERIVGAVLDGGHSSSSRRSSCCRASSESGAQWDGTHPSEPLR